MPLPDFLCIGAQKAGTTWLDQMLRSHPDIGMPVTGKELHFFDAHYEKGITWYKSQFPRHCPDSGDRAVIGEVTPSYINKLAVPARIYDTLGRDPRFVVLLRNPVDRLYSQYKMNSVNRGRDTDFHTFVKNSSNPFRHGLYSEQIERYFNLFPQENFVFLIYERLVHDIQTELARLAAHLEVDQHGFDTGLAARRYNTYEAKPRFYRTYLAARTFQDYLRKHEFYAPIRLAKRLGARKGLFGKAAQFPPVPDALRAELMARYADDIARTEALTGLDLRSWWGDPA